MTFYEIVCNTCRFHRLFKILEKNTKWKCNSIINNILNESVIPLYKVHIEITLLFSIFLEKKMYNESVILLYNFFPGTKSKWKCDSVTHHTTELRFYCVFFSSLQSIMSSCFCCTKVVWIFCTMEFRRGVILEFRGVVGANNNSLTSALINSS